MAGVRKGGCGGTIIGRQFRDFSRLTELVFEYCFCVSGVHVRFLRVDIKKVADVWGKLMFLVYWLRIHACFC